MNSIRQVTVFGGSGFIGRAIVRELARQGFVVRAAARRIELADALKTAGDVGQITLMRANMRVPQSVAAAIAGSQAVINAAGIPFQRGRQRYEQVHVDGARTIAQAANAFGVQRLVHLSGIGADSRSSRNRFIRSKVAAESALIGAFENTVVLRPSVVFGAGDQIFNRMARIACQAPFMPLVGNGRARVQPVFVSDVAKAAVEAVVRPEAAKKTYELGGPRIYTYRELAELVLREIDRSKPIVGIPAPLMKIAGFLAEFLPVPPLTYDQIDLLTQDNVVRAGALGFADLGIEPIAAEAILPTYLDRFRVGGRYNQHAPA